MSVGDLFGPPVVEETALRPAIVQNTINSQIARIRAILAALRGKENKVRVWKYLGDDFKKLEKDFLFNIELFNKSKDPESFRRFMSNTLFEFEEMHDAVEVCEHKMYEFFDSRSGVIRNLDIPYSNKYILKMYKAEVNPRFDKRFTRTLINKAEQLSPLLEDMKVSGHVAFDIETTGFDPRGDKLVGASFAYTTKDSNNELMIKSFYLPCGHTNERSGQMDMFDSARPAEVIVQLKVSDVVGFLQDIINANIPIIVHNGAFDIKWMMYLGNKFPQGYDFDDTLLMIKCFDERVRAGLKESALRELKYVMTKFEEVSKGRKFNEIGLSEALSYAATDAIMTRQLWARYKKLLEQNNTWKVYKEIEQPCIVPIAEVELNGCLVDEEYFKKLKSSLILAINKMQSQIRQLGGVEAKEVDSAMNDWERSHHAEIEEIEEYNDLNLASTAQLSDLLYNKLNLPVFIRSEATGAPSTSSKALAKIKSQHEIVGLILQYRKAMKMLNAYVGPIKDFISPVTGKIHSQVRQMGARSSRMSMTKPSLQVLPRDADTWDIRKGFVAAPGNVIIEADFCQMELMKVAAESQEPVMLEAFRFHKQMIDLLWTGIDHKDPEILRLKLLADLHIKSAAAATVKSLSEVTDNERTILGKTLNFLTVYLGTKVGLSEILTARGVPTTPEQAQTLIDNFFRTYKNLKKWLDAKQAEAEFNHYVVHSCGRIINKPSQFYDGITGGEIRTLVNSCVQGECASRFKLGLKKLYWGIKNEFAGYPVKIINLVHDAVYIEAPKDIGLLQRLLRLNRECMEYEFKGVHFSVEQTIKTSMSKTDKVKIPSLIYA